MPFWHKQLRQKETSPTKMASLVLVPILAQVSLKVSLTQVILILLALIWALLLLLLASLSLNKLDYVNIIIKSALLTLLAPIEDGHGKPKRLLQQVNKFHTLTNKNMEIIGLLKNFVSKVFNPKQFVTSNRLVIPEEISRNTYKNRDDNDKE